MAPHSSGIPHSSSSVMAQAVPPHCHLLTPYFSRSSSNATCYTPCSVCDAGRVYSSFYIRCCHCGDLGTHLIIPHLNVGFFSRTSSPSPSSGPWPELELSKACCSLCFSCVSSASAKFVSSSHDFLPSLGLLLLH